MLLENNVKLSVLVIVLKHINWVKLCFKYHFYEDKGKKCAKSAACKPISYFFQMYLI